MIRARLPMAVLSTVLEEALIFLLWRWVLPDFGVNLAVWVLVLGMVVWLIFSVALFIFTTRVLKKQAMVGLPGMVGSRGRVKVICAPEGMVKIRGELWQAMSRDGEIGVGEDVEVVGEDGLKLMVRRWR